MLAIRLQRPTPQRNFFFVVQLVVGLGLLIAARFIYAQLPYYQSFLSPTTQALIEQIFVVLCIIWVTDAVIKYLFRANLPITTASLLFVYLYKWSLKIRSKITGKTRKVDTTLDKRTQTAILALVVKLFFFPIMLSTAVGNGFALAGTWQSLLSGNTVINFNFIYNNSVTLIFFLDTLIFAFGYVFESKWLGNQIRSVEPTMLGWVVALATYPPFNGVTGTIFPLNRGDYAPTSQVVTYFLQLAILLCHVVFLWASFSLGTKATNLTNRGTVSRGAYRWVRHPAYTAKLTGWLIEGFLFVTTPLYFVFWLCWLGIYYLRAWTEERHLSQDPDYLAYKQKVKWVCWPGLV